MGIKWLPNKFNIFIDKGSMLVDSYQKMMNMLTTFYHIFTKPSITGKFIASNFFHIDGITCVEPVFKNNVHEIRIFINEENWELEDNVYNKYSELVSEYPEINFEVHVFYLLGRSPEEVSQLM
ncbi:MAG: hypothetical protein ACFFDN_33495 [Candidatus Hodarchaeota archaeon]